MKAAKSVRVVIGLMSSLLLAAAPALLAQEGAGKKTESFGEGRIIGTDGTKIRVSSFVIETGIDRIAYSDDRLKGAADPERSYLALNMVRSIQVRRRPTFGSVAQTSILAGFAGGIVSLLASDPWGGPTKDTWPAIGLGTAACAAAGAVISFTVRRYTTVYTNPDAVPKPIIKLTMGPVAPRTNGLSFSIAY
jgi:hypothetical protein